MIDFIRHLLVPHPTNNFKAKLLHYDFFALYIVLFMLMTFSFRLGHRLDPNILGFATSIHVNELVHFTNEKRVAAGLPALRLDPQLSQAAAGKAVHMFDKDYWAHNAPDGTTPWDFINGAGYIYTVAGENLAKNFDNSAGVVEAWMNSPTHRANILRNEYIDVGFAVVNGRLGADETTLVVQMFGKRVTPGLAQARTDSPESEAAVATAFAQEDPEAVVLDADEIATPVAEVKPAPTAEVVVPAAARSVVREPLLDIRQTAKNVLLALSVVLLAVLVIDGLYIWRKKIIRLQGRTFAHIWFIFVLTGLVWMMSFGSIL